MGNKKKRGNHHGTEHHDKSHQHHDDHHPQPDVYSSQGAYPPPMPTWSPLTTMGHFAYSALQTPDGQYRYQIAGPLAFAPPNQGSSSTWAGNFSTSYNQYLSPYHVPAAQQPTGGMNAGVSASPSDRDGVDHVHAAGGSATGEEDDDDGSSSASSKSEGVKRKGSSKHSKHNRHRSRDSNGHRRHSSRSDHRGAARKHHRQAEKEEQSRIIVDDWDVD
ncbi:hypothetical protein PG993_008816 [Apiospora rasikravindrae]|uniref:Uncharacterized protein n=1 Tax=Apiospora rasikravindrae TaxID=990691 RepID=A0ABR1SPT5_9PEZI